MRSASAILAATIVLIGCGGNDDARPLPTASPTTTTDNVPPPPAEPRPLETGAVTVRVSTGAARILGYAGARLTTIGDARSRDRELTFPITGGRLAIAPPTGRVDLGGGLRLRAGNDHVDATALRLDPAQEVVTAVIQGQRVPLLRFKLRYPKALPAAGRPVIANGSASIVGARALERIGAEFGVDLLRDGLPLGTMRLIAVAAAR